VFWPSAAGSEMRLAAKSPIWWTFRG
jgi:hypothetical protein